MNKNALRHVSTYDPAADLSDVLYYSEDGKPGEPEKFLETKFRLLWFQHYLYERSLTGYIDDGVISYVAAAKCLIAKATVYINGNIVGRSCAGMFYSPAVAAQDPNAAQALETQAMGRALANAGFSTAECVDNCNAPFAGATVQLPYRRSQGCSFNVSENLTTLPERNGTEIPYLATARQVQWFNRYLADMGLKGFLDNSEVSYDPDAKLFTVTAYVYIDGVLVGRSSASRAFDPETPGLYDEAPVSRAGTAALGRALTNAGFGICATALVDEPIPCDSGVKVSRDELGDHVRPVYQRAIPGVNTPRQPSLPPREDATPAPEPAASAEAAAPAEKPDEPTEKPKRRGRPPKEKPKDAEETTVPLANGKKEGVSGFQTVPLAPMPKDEALAFVIPVGTFKDRTVGDVIQEHGVGVLSYYASDRFINPEYTDLKRAVIAAQQ